MKTYRVNMVRAAYDGPIFNDPTLHARRVADLTDRFFITCYDNWAALSGVADPTKK